MKPFNPWRLLPFWREALVLVISTWTAIWVWIRARQAQSWPTTQATISGTSVRANARSSYIYTWLAILTYTYVVDGEYYSGTCELKARSERRADELVEGWKGRMIVLHYSPTKHDISVALKSDQPGGQLGN